MKSSALIDLTMIDFGIILVVAISVIIGLFRGFVKEVLSIAVWVLSVFITLKFYEHITVYFTGLTDNTTVRSGIAVAILFLGCLIVGSIVNHFISTLVKSTGLSGTDKLLGVVFGFLRGGLIVSVIMLIISFTEFSKSPIYEDSFLTKQMQPLVKWLDSFIPDTVKKKVATTQEKSS